MQCRSRALRDGDPVHPLQPWCSPAARPRVLPLPLSDTAGATCRFLGDFILLTLIVLFAELVKATYTSVSLVDHGLSMMVFVACIVEFLVVNQAATSVFFLVMVASLIDVVAGFTIGIRVARRDLSIGGAD
jgi:hypothetical protein